MGGRAILPLSAIAPCFAAKRDGSILHSPWNKCSIESDSDVVLLFFPPGSAEAHNQPLRALELQLR